MTDAGKEAWIEWRGGENPAPGQDVEIEWSDGSREKDGSNSFPWDWSGTGRIIAYRLAASGEAGLAGYAGVKDAEVNNSLPTQGGGAGDRETAARIIDPEAWALADELLAKTPALPERVAEYTATSLAKAEAILSALQAAPSEGEITRQQVAETLDRWIGWCEHNEAEFTGWGDGDVPEGATTWTINAKAARALIANDAPRFAAPSEGGEPVAWIVDWKFSSGGGGSQIIRNQYAAVEALLADLSKHPALASTNVDPLYRSRPPAPSEEPLVGTIKDALTHRLYAKDGRVVGFDEAADDILSIIRAAPAPDAIRGGEGALRPAGSVPSQTEAAK